MNTRATRISWTLMAALLLIGCGSTGSEPSVLSEPVVDSPGKHISRYRGPALESLVDYGFAASSLGGEWMILNVSVSGTRSENTEIRSDSIWLRTPGGTRIPLPPYEQFAEAYSEVQAISRRAAIASSPLGFTRGDRNWCHMSFHPTPGTAAVLTSVYVNHRRQCQGFLYFQIPGGIQPGRYALGIELEETDVVVPFILEGPAQ